jgi:hypothetical protein
VRYSDLIKGMGIALIQMTAGALVAVGVAYVVTGGP